MQHLKKSDAIGNFENLFAEILELYRDAKQVEEKRREQGDLFNIFNVIGLRSEEVRLHSAFIAELLNPKGNHGSSYLFLQAFLELLGIEDGYIDYARCSPNIKERYIGSVTKTEGGSIDIIIEDGNHAVIIENKIYAKDQDNQLLRYYNYGKKEFPKGFQLLYLTLHGCEPSSRSLGGKDIKHRTISYETEIICWLDKCYEIAEGKPLSQAAIKQYSELIKQLTNKDEDMQYVEKMMSIMLTSENAIAVGEILKKQDEWFDALIEEYIWNPLKQFAETKGLLFDKDCTCKYPGGWVYKKMWKHYGIEVRADKASRWGDMYVGVSCYGQNNPKGKYKIPIRKKNKLICLESSPCKDWPYGWEYLKPSFCNWDESLTEEIVQGKVVECIKEKFEQILTEIEERKLPMY